MGTLIPTVKSLNPAQGDLWYDRDTNIIYHFSGMYWRELTRGILCACGCFETEHERGEIIPVTGDREWIDRVCKGCDKCLDFSEDNLEWLLRRDSIRRSAVC